ncbi:MAG: hypothetical protein DSM106950_21255 [Stigonema ocellatum SAG 48.90 = DSM 106950]|nr:hypothetical protein [Stigonema ocellatum SAG 48.90 = DSM 106950]
MKGLIIGSLSLCLLSTATAPAVRADTTVFNPTVTSSRDSGIPQITPFNLVNLAYRGYFKDQGIPGYSALRMAYLEQKVSALDIVRSAVKTRRLPEEVLSNKQYVNSVAQQLSATFYNNPFF